MVKRGRVMAGQTKTVTSVSYRIMSFEMTRVGDMMVLGWESYIYKFVAKVSKALGGKLELKGEGGGESQVPHTRHETLIT